VFACCIFGRDVLKIQANPVDQQSKETFEHKNVQAQLAENKIACFSALYIARKFMPVGNVVVFSC
jgi:hypothetical protein